MDSENTFADRLNQLAAARHLTQTAIARGCGVSPQSVQRWFSGTATPRGHLLPALAKQLDVSVTELVSGIGKLEVAAKAQGIAAAAISDSTDDIFTDYYRALIAWRSARIQYQRSSTATIAVAVEYLLDELLWHGYAQPEDLPPRGILNNSTPLRGVGTSSVVVQDSSGDAGIYYLLNIRMTAPTLADAHRSMPRHMAIDEDIDAPLVPISVVAYNDPNTRKPAFLMLPLGSMDREEAVRITRDAERWIDKLSAIATGTPPVDDSEDEDDLSPPPSLTPFINRFTLEALHRSV